MLIEPHLTGPPDDPRPHPCAFRLAYELVDLGERPHLNGGSEPAALDFAVRAAVSAAFSDVHLDLPLCLAVERISRPGLPLLVDSRWRLAGGTLATDAMANVDRIQASLGCEALHIAPCGRSGMRLVFGAPHDTTELTAAGSATGEKILDAASDRDITGDDPPSATDEATCGSDTPSRAA